MEAEEQSVVVEWVEEYVILVNRIVKDLVSSIDLMAQTLHQ